mgnify:CR=1 FL=1
MEYPIGIEMSKDYLSYEVSKAAYKLVHDAGAAGRERSNYRRYLYG